MKFCKRTTKYGVLQVSTVHSVYIATATNTDPAKLTSSTYFRGAILHYETLLNGQHSPVLWQLSAVFLPTLGLCSELLCSAPGLSSVPTFPSSMIRPTTVSNINVHRWWSFPILPSDPYVRTSILSLVLFSQPFHYPSGHPSVYPPAQPTVRQSDRPTLSVGAPARQPDRPSTRPSVSPTDQ